jgi:hypothetical protein
VKNITNRTIILSDINAEINARKILDLERVASIVEIERSYDLRHALKTNRLQLLKHNITRQDKPRSVDVQVIEVEKIVERETLNEARLVELIKKAVAETTTQQKQPAPPASIDISKQAGQFNDILNDLRNKIANFQPGPDSQILEPIIDPKKLAEITNKSVDKISEEIESNTLRKSRKIKITPSKPLDDLAGELD